MAGRRHKPRHPADWPQSLRWAVQFLPQYFCDQPAHFHADLMRALEQPDRRLVARVAPRGHAKSTCAAFAYPLWSLCEQRRRNIVIVTHEASLATQFVADIRNELETNEAIIDAYGDLRRDPPEPPADAPPAGASRAKEQRAGRAPAKSSAGKRESATARSPKRRARSKWSEAMFTTVTGVTVQAKGTGASFRGMRVGPQRPDLIICDDIEKDEHVASPEGRQKLEHWLRRVVLPALAPDGQLLVLGSLIHYDSLLANLSDPGRFRGWDYGIYRALEAEPDERGVYRLRALWPARWSVEQLEQERERIGTLAFEQEYQANPIDDSLRVFRPEWLRSYDPAELEGLDFVTLMAVDPAAGVSGGDYFALWVGSLARQTGVIYTRVLELARIGIVEQVKRIIAAFQRWKPVRIGIETVAYQVALKQILEHCSRMNGLYMPIVSIQTTANKRARIEGSAPFYENGTFRLPPALVPDAEEQFLHFPKAKHDDAPDVCAMGIELARALRTGVAASGVTGSSSPFGRNAGW